MAMKLALFVSLMVAALAVPISGAQRMGYLIEIHGTVYCPGNSNTNASGTNNVVFAIAEIHVVCDGKAIDYAYTNEHGGFLFAVDNERYTIPEILKTCKLVVISALTACPKPSPSTGHLESNLKYIGDTTVGGNLKISNIVPAGFHVVP
ncbi:hypothetical protein CMV_020371 [Castanea mollissima]|uniref:Pollen Ole e 1 allergen and extensin family protein n=1 Tax=Castanea mollissima TaxID=60419 RepID=A0A8J4QYQ3_9ROSI|nr:hypothetical protein CMV_020371 [Castanea mollissima]